MSNFIPHFIMVIITYPYWDWSETVLLKGVPDHQLWLITSSPQNKYGFLKSNFFQISSDDKP